MSCRRPLYSSSQRSSSRSPTKNTERLSDIRNQFSADDKHECYEDGDDSDSVESDDYVEQTTEKLTDTETEQLPEQSSVTLESTANSAINTPPSPKPEPKRKERQQMTPLVKTKTEHQANSQFKLIVYAIIIILPLIACSRLLYKDPEPKRCAFDALRHRQPLQSPDVWKALTINIQLLLNKKTKSPNVYLFLHSKDSNEQKIQTLIQDIALETSKCFDGQRPIEMGLKDFETKSDDDYGYPIEQYKKKLREGNVFVIVNLNDISPNAARALHTICDTHSPIAPDVVIFLNLRTHLTLADGGPSQLAYRTLQEIWQEVPDNELDPLITRVVDQVQWLQS